MKKYTYSARLCKALNNETKDVNVLVIISRKDKCTKRDVLNLTGIYSRDYDLIFDETQHPTFRVIKADFFATCALSSYFEDQYKGFLPHQKAVTELIWKGVKGLAIEVFSQQYHHITGRFLEDDYYYEDWVGEETYEITDEELAEAAEVVKKHLAEVSETPNAAHA